MVKFNQSAVWGYSYFMCIFNTGMQCCWHVIIHEKNLYRGWHLVVPAESYSGTIMHWQSWRSGGTYQLWELGYSGWAVKTGYNQYAICFIRLPQ